MVTIYAPVVAIIPCAKFVVNDVLKISTIANVTSANGAASASAKISLFIISIAIGYRYPHLTIFAAQTYPIPAANMHTTVPSLTCPVCNAKCSDNI